MLQQRERCPPLSAYTVLDNKLASCTSVITSKCPRVSSVNHPLPMFITNSGLCAVIWLHKCSALLCVISTIQIIPFHIFAKWPKWRVVTITVRSSLKNIMMGSTAIPLTPTGGITVSTGGFFSFFFLFSYPLSNDITF